MKENHEPENFLIFYLLTHSRYFISFLAKGVTKKVWNN